MHLRRRTALVGGPVTLGLVAAALPVALGAAPGSAAPAAELTDPAWHRLATYPVHENRPEGTALDEETVAEISDISEDGLTMAYTDAGLGVIGFIDLTDPENPVGDGSYDVGGEPTSVSIVGDHVLVVVDESNYDETGTSGNEVRDGKLDVIKLSDHSLAASIDLEGQPDSIAISPDGAYAAIAMENERNELLCKDGATITVDPGDIKDSTCSEGELGDLPQAPAGSVQVIDLVDPAVPATWTNTNIALPEADLADAGVAAPSDPEPEYVDINVDNKLAVSLQENNAVVIIDLATETIDDVWSAGNAQVDGIDDNDDGIFDFSASIDVPREPDSLNWIGTTHIATANEGDWLGGSRGWSVFDASGNVAWDAGNTFEHLAVEHGLFNDGRADNKGAEPEGLTVAEISGTETAFVGSERSNFVATYDVSDPTDPVLGQVLPTTNGPEGLLPVTNRGDGRELLVVSSEEDDAEAGVRATVAVYEYGDKPAGAIDFPTLVSAEAAGSDPAHPIGWGALGALSADPGDATRLWAASDSAYVPGRIYGIDVSTAPAVIDEVIDVTDGGDLAEIDIEGLHALADGSFLAAVEGVGADNKVLEVAADGAIQGAIELPTEVTNHIAKWGLEGITATGAGAAMDIFVAVQRPLWVDPSAETREFFEGDVARIGRYDTATEAWDWFGYPLESTSVAGDWIGLSELVAVDEDTLAVIERDKLNGPDAALKAIYTVDIPATGVTGDTAITAPLTKTLTHDVLPDLQAPRGWVQEKLEGLTIGGDGEVYAVTDNDGVDDATGETVFLRLGAASAMFPADKKCEQAEAKVAKKEKQLAKKKKQRKKAKKKVKRAKKKLKLAKASSKAGKIKGAKRHLKAKKKKWKKKRKQVKRKKAQLAAAEAARDEVC